MFTCVRLVSSCDCWNNYSGRKLTQVYHRGCKLLKGLALLSIHKMQCAVGDPVNVNTFGPAVCIIV